MPSHLKGMTTAAQSSNGLADNSVNEPDNDNDTEDNERSEVVSEPAAQQSAASASTAPANEGSAAFPAVPPMPTAKELTPIAVLGSIEV